MKIEEALTFDDVLLLPAASSVLPTTVDTSSFLTANISLGAPIISAAMDTVTDGNLAIVMAQNGGIGCVHKNMSIDEQASAVRTVKKFVSGMVINPVTISPEANLAQALSLMKENRISGIPVLEQNSNKLVGILTNRDVRFAEDAKQSVAEFMTKHNLITVAPDISEKDAKTLLHQHRIEKLIVVDANYCCIGLITVKDIEKARAFPNASKDAQGRLRVAAAVGTGSEGVRRAEQLIEAGVDVIIVDTAHGHSQGVLETVANIRRLSSAIQIIGGNIATRDAAQALIDVGVSAVKIGIGPGSICTTRIIAGVGVPQLSAIMNAVQVCRDNNVKIIADGGIRYSGDLAKAIAAGADCVMIGSLFAGTEESPGETVLYQGRSYKAYRGMGSIGAMAKGSADRYFQQDVRDNLKLVPEGVEGLVPFKGPVADVIHQLIGGLRAAMGYTGNADIATMQRNCQFVKITNAGLKESHAHDITITRETPNYAI
jgi:IMP dehydrogenase